MGPDRERHPRRHGCAAGLRAGRTLTPAWSVLHGDLGIVTTQLAQVAPAPYPLSAPHLGADDFALKAAESRLLRRAKGGAGRLSEAGRLLPDSTRAPQGSTLYFNDVARVDPSFQEWLRQNPDIVGGIADGRITPRYQLVHAPARGPVRIHELTLVRTALDIRVHG